MATKKARRARAENGRAKLIATARHLPFPQSDVGAGLVQAPPF